MTKFYIETYGCQMNVADSELVVSIMQDNDFILTNEIQEANIIFANTCSIRDNAEKRIWGRLDVFKQIKKNKPSLLIGILGCMAERLKYKLLEEENLVDLIVGPDSYRDLPNLVKLAESGQKGVNVLLSIEETYAEINPVRYSSNGISAFISVMRGCDNMCTYCVVPFTRGRERSRDPLTIVNEANELIKNGYKEVTLLGQNIDKYNWMDGKTNFAQLLELIAKISPELRVRFATSHPQDMTNDVLKTIEKYDNICDNIHLAVQSGSSSVLKRMRRGYDREFYLDRIKAIREIIPNCAISTDIIAGFCGETDADYQDTVSLMETVKFDMAYMFKYSVRPNTYAQRNFKDDVPECIKSKRLSKIIDIQRQSSNESNKRDLNKVFKVLIEGVSKKSEDNLYGRNSQNKVVVFAKENFKPGDYANVLVTDCTSATLLGKVVD